ncbi:type I-E CRISPR-associated protein Cas5/CasD [Actinomadura parmotrematis]|uniref:Type I-E CRISPR-associated protein Cas5/CasD n=1 Tax=Actinomadura parmotrematis TaxID=2864039 RepID=A0ABS7FXW3_9ACTN|nr:type I-E CRISPR-associated protein Cas5/CasD [Actinomadura parmotrematis]MBW8484437.1 type I-E CRISPR-associated protein Cas5/CasD [Actinomadura parmotrematis]
MSTTAFLLHLSGPMQSWGERSRFNERDTSTAPTRSGLIGLISSALGRARDRPIGELAALGFTVRIDRPGRLLRDFHTVGGGMPRSLTVITAEGKRRSSDKATLISDRYYLADAAFTVAVTAPDAGLLDECAAALRDPVWPPYLGRRSCPPTAPLLLTTITGDPLEQLIKLPLARVKPNGETESVRVEFRSDAPLEHPEWPHLPAADQIYTEIQDDPVSFLPHHRRYQTRPVYRRHEQLPADQCGGYGTDYIDRLIEHLGPAPSPGSAPS